MKICKKCQKVNNDDVEICEECGSKEFVPVTEKPIEEQVENNQKENNEELENNLNETVEYKNKWQLFWARLKMVLSNKKSLVTIGCMIVLCSLALVYFAIQIVGFKQTLAIYGICIIIEIIWSILTAICIALFVMSIVFNAKASKKDKEIDDNK